MRILQYVHSCSQMAVVRHNMSAQGDVQFKGKGLGNGQQLTAHGNIYQCISRNDCTHLRKHLGNQTVATCIYHKKASMLTKWCCYSHEQ